MIVDTHLYRQYQQSNVDCAYSLEPPQLGGSNIYAQSVFRGKIKEKNNTPEVFHFYSHSNRRVLLKLVIVNLCKCMVDIKSIVDS